MPAGKILVTPRSLTASGHPALALIEASGYELVLATAGRQPDEGELLRLVPGCVGWLAGVEPVSSAVIASASALRAISRNGVGADNLPMRMLQDRGVKVLTAAGSNASGVAELALALILAALRHIPAVDAGVKAGGWPRLRGRELRGRTLGVVGCGAIGAEVARLVTALGVRVVGHDLIRRDLGLPPERFGWATVPELLAAADIVTLHCPPAPDGQPVIGAHELAAMRQGSILINTARATLVDEAAIIAALAAGHLDVYAADSFAEEPPRSLALAGHPRVIATSHIGAFTAESVDRATLAAVQNLLKALADAG